MEIKYNKSAATVKEPITATVLKIYKIDWTKVNGYDDIIAVLKGIDLSVFLTKDDKMYKDLKEYLIEEQA